MKKAIAIALVAFALAVLAAAAPRRPQPDPAERTPGPVRYMIEVEVVEPDETRSWKDAGTFDTLSQAVTEVERITHDGLCIFEDPSTPELAATCYPPVRHIRTRLLKVVLL
jgi:hypothetical protein